MGYVVLHIDKATGNDAGMSAHIERTIDPANADKERTCLNRELVDFPEEVNSRTQAIQHRLDTAGLTRKIGTNQVRALRIMLSGTSEDMHRIEAAGRLGECCDDNLRWLRHTYGADNLVSAVLHMDETTPHIHAKVIPIVTGERRKAADKPTDPAKKQYRKKNRQAARLCADDVMARPKLKEYQNTYAEAMNKYGLQRGIDGSEARHITTSKFYRNIFSQQGNIQENIDNLLRHQEAAQQATEQLRQQEQEARGKYEQTTALKEQKQQELKEVKGQIQTAKLKGALTDMGISAANSIGSVFSGGKANQLQSEIKALRNENNDLQDRIDYLTDQNDKLKREVASVKKEKEIAIDKLQQEMQHFFGLMPKIGELFQIAKLCRVIGFSDELTRSILEMKPVGFKGSLYSPEHRCDFHTDYSVAEVKPMPSDHDKLYLTIDNVSDTQWFRYKNKASTQNMGINIPSPRQKSNNQLNYYGLKSIGLKKNEILEFYSNIQLSAGVLGFSL